MARMNLVGLVVVTELTAVHIRVPEQRFQAVEILEDSGSEFLWNYSNPWF